MKPTKTLLPEILFSSLCVLLTCSFNCTADDDSNNARGITPLSQSARLKSQAKKLDWLTNWPSEAEISDHKPKACTNNAARLTTESDGKPDVTPQTSPEAALYEAKYWISTVLQPEWVPDDLSKHLIAMQASDAKHSTVICRYETKGNKIQVIQKKTVMCIVVRPQPDILRNAARDADKGRIVFGKFFRKGEVMASTPAVDITEPGDTTRVFVPDKSKLPPSDADNWWGWKAWYTDGGSVAVLLDKRSEDMQHIPNPDDLWF